MLPSHKNYSHLVGNILSVPNVIDVEVIHIHTKKTHTWDHTSWGFISWIPWISVPDLWRFMGLTNWPSDTSIYWAHFFKSLQTVFFTNMQLIFPSKINYYNQNTSYTDNKHVFSVCTFIGKWQTLIYCSASQSWLIHMCPLSSPCNKPFIELIKEWIEAVSDALPN